MAASFRHVIILIVPRPVIKPVYILYPIPQLKCIIRCCRCGGGQSLSKRMYLKGTIEAIKLHYKYVSA